MLLKCFFFLFCELKGSYTCRCDSGYVGNQTIGCRSQEGLCPDGRTRCDRNAECYHIGYGKFRCKCKVGFAGDGVMCGPDTDIDGWPDYDLRCHDPRCRKVNTQQFSQIKTHHSQTQRQWRVKRAKLHKLKNYRKNKLETNKHNP